MAPSVWSMASTCSQPQQAESVDISYDSQCYSAGACVPPMSGKVLSEQCGSRELRESPGHAISELPLAM